MQDCPFCSRVSSASSLILATDHVIAFPDAYPVSPGHSLIVPRRHVGRLSELTQEEHRGMWDCVRDVQRSIEMAHGPDAWNIGVNDGAASGQTIMHVHLHVIPRYAGDVADPRGGIRWVLPSRAAYWSGS